MSFISTFEELNKLYESVEPEVKEEEVVEETVEEALTEAVEEVDETEEATAEKDETEEVIEIDAEEEQEEPKQIILECSNCGGLVIKAEADVAVDEESDLANISDACQYCEEAAGYKIVGLVTPYKATEADGSVGEDTGEDIVEESLLDVNLPIDVDVQANGNDVSVGTLG